MVTVDPTFSGPVTPVLAVRAISQTSVPFCTVIVEADTASTFAVMVVVWPKTAVVDKQQAISTKRSDLVFIVRLKLLRAVERKLLLSRRRAAS